MICGSLCLKRRPAGSFGARAFDERLPLAEDALQGNLLGILSRLCAEAFPVRGIVEKEWIDRESTQTI